VADRLQAAVPPGGLVARMGGDEFIVLVERCSGETRLRALTEQLLAALAEPIVVAGQVISIGASIGTAVVAEAPAAINELLHTVDTAMYRDKATHPRSRRYR